MKTGYHNKEAVELWLVCTACVHVSEWVCALSDLRSCRTWCWTLSMERSLAGWPSKDPLSIRCLVQALKTSTERHISPSSLLVINATNIKKSKKSKKKKAWINQSAWWQVRITTTLLNFFPAQKAVPWPSSFWFHMTADPDCYFETVSSHSISHCVCLCVCPSEHRSSVQQSHVPEQG